MLTFLFSNRSRFVTLILFSLFLFPGIAFADVLENFDSLSNGALNGQGGWSGSTDPAVQGTTVQGGTKAVSRAGGGGSDPLKKDITDITVDDSTASCYVRTDTPSNAGGGSFGCNFWTTTTDLFGLRLSQDDNNIRIEGATNVSIGTASANTWYKLEIQFDFTGNRARARLDGGSWSSYVNAKGSVSYSQITHIGVQYGGIVGNGYIDTYEATYATEPILGCTDPDATNYDPTATQDDDSCEYSVPLSATSTILGTSITSSQFAQEIITPIKLGILGTIELLQSGQKYFLFLIAIAFFMSAMYIAFNRVI